MVSIAEKGGDKDQSLVQKLTKGNFSRNMRRALDAGNKKIDDLISFANEKPNIIQRQVFSQYNLQRLLNAISKGNSLGVYDYDNRKKKVILNEEDTDCNTEYNNRQLTYGALLIKEGTNIFKDQYKRIYNREFDERLKLLETASKYAEELAFPHRVINSFPLNKLFTLSELPKENEE
jgi:hypothetical protein